MDKQVLVTQSSMPNFEKYCEKIKPLWESKWLTNAGIFHNELVEKLKSYMKADNVDLFVNGHLALVVALQALALSGEIITTPFTFVSTTTAIVSNGLTPVFCDIKEDFTIDESKIESLITDKTSAILAVHVYGNVCNIEKIDAIAKKHNLKVIYDAAHAFGECYNGKSIANYGDISMFSFHATKVFNTIEGGCLVFKDKSLTEKIKAIRNFGLVGEDVAFVGTNAKMNEFQAAMGICNLENIETEIEKRRLVSTEYDKNLCDIDGIKINVAQDKYNNYAYYPVCFDESVFGFNRDEVAIKLAEHNIFARKYFYPCTNEMSAYKGKFEGNTPIASKKAKDILCLPMYADLKLEDVARICNIIKKI